MNYSKEAEQSVLGALMLEELAYSLVIDTGIKATDFVNERHQIAFKAMAALAEDGKPLDVVTVAEWLDERKKLDDAGGAQYLSLMVDMTPSIENCRAYAEIVVDYSRKRDLANMAAGIDAMREDGEPLEAILDYASAEITRIGEGKSAKTAFTGSEAVKKTMQNLQDKFDNKVTQYKTGLSELDDVLRIEKGRMTLIAGRPGSGKSSMANCIMATNGKADIPTIVFTMEMPADECAGRLVCYCGNVDNSFMQNPNGYGQHDEQMARVATGGLMIKEFPLLIDEKTRASAEHIRASARAFLRRQERYTKDGLGMVIIDYLGLMKMPGDNRTHAIGMITKMLKGLAIEMAIPVVILHQLNRGLENRPDRRPQLSDLRDSGEIEEDVDHAIMVYRDEMYYEDSPDKGLAELLIRKNRTGPNNVCVKVQAIMKHYKFSDRVFQSY